MGGGCYVRTWYILLQYTTTVLRRAYVRIGIRHHNGPKSHIFLNAYIPYLVLITMFPGTNTCVVRSKIDAMGHQLKG